MAVRVSELRGSECCPVIGQIEVASPRWDKITSPETELTSRRIFCHCEKILDERRILLDRETDSKAVSEVRRQILTRKETPSAEV